MKHINFLSNLVAKNEVNRALAAEKMLQNIKKGGASQSCTLRSEGAQVTSARSAVDVPTMSYGASDEHPMSTRSASDGKRWNSRVWKYAAMIFAVLVMSVANVGMAWGASPYNLDITSYTWGGTGNKSANDGTVTINAYIQSKKYNNTASTKVAFLDGSNYLKVSASSACITSISITANTDDGSNTKQVAYQTSADGSSWSASTNMGTCANRESTPTERTVNFSPAVQYVRFTKGENNSISVGAISVTYSSGVTHTVTAATDDEDKGTAAAGSTTVAEGATTTITATPKSGYQFDHWTVSGTGASLSSTTTNPTTLTMGTADATVTAYFAERECPSSGTLFSLAGWSSSNTSSWTTANNSTVAITGLGTLTGGTATAVSIESSKVPATNGSGDNMAYSLGYNSVALYCALDCPLQEGDEITIVSNGSHSYTFILTKTNSRSSSVTTSASSGTNTYTVTGSDILHGQSNLYIWRSSSTLNIKTINITRPVTCTAPNHVDISGNYHFFPGETLALTATAYSTEGTSNPIAAGDITGYQWQKYIGSEWEDIDGATSATYTKVGATTSDVGQYRCTISTGATCSTTSGTFNAKCLQLYVYWDNKSDKCNLPFTKVDGTHATVNVSLENGSYTYYYKVTDGCGNWWGNDGTMTSSNCSGWNLNVNNHCGLTTSKAATYTFNLTFDAGLTSHSMSVVYPSYVQAGGYPIYFDNTDRNWNGAKIYYRIGRNNYNSKGQMSLVPGTANLYTTNTIYYESDGGFEAWHVANNGGWSESHSVYKTKNLGEWTITEATRFEGSPIPSGGITVLPGSDHSTGTTSGSGGDADNANNNCEFYSYTTTPGMLTHNVSITPPTHGTITITYTDVNNVAQTFSSGNRDLAHTCIITVTAEGTSGYQDPVNISINGSNYQNRDPYTLMNDAVITAEFVPAVYTVTLNTNGGTINAGNVTSYTYGTGATLPTNVTKDGYTFDGWFDNAGLTGSAVTTISSSATGNKEFWAKWTAAASQTALECNTLYEVPDMIPSGESLTSRDQFFDGLSANTKFELIGSGSGSTTPKVNNNSSNDKTIDGITFDDGSMWFKGTASLTSNIPTTFGLSFIVPEGGGKLYLYFSGTSTNIKLAKSGEEGSKPSCPNGYGAVDVTAGTYYLYGTGTDAPYCFYGLKLCSKYNVSISTTNVTKTDGATGAGAAIHGRAYEATFTASAGYTLPNDVTVSIGGAAQTKGTGYTWTVSSGTGTLTVPAAQVTGNIVVTVTGTAAATYSITYNCDGEESGCPINVAAATNLPSPLPTGLTKDGYDFVGWYTDSEKTVAAVAGAALTANTTLYAKWTEHSESTCITITNFATSNSSGTLNVYKGSISDANKYLGKTTNSNTVGKNSGTDMLLKYKSSITVYNSPTEETNFTNVIEVHFDIKANDNTKRSGFEVYVGATKVATIDGGDGGSTVFNKDSYTTMDVTGLAQLTGYIRITSTSSSGAAGYDTYIDNIQICTASMDACTTPVILSLSNQTVCAGGDVTAWNATQTASLATGESASYKWQKKNGSNWDDISGATSATYDVSDAVTEAMEGTYRVVVTVSKTGYASTSANREVTLTVTPATETPSVTQSVATVYPGNAVTLTATSTTGATWQWYTCSDAEGTGASAIGGATSASYAIASAPAAGTYYYKVTATGDDTNSCGSASTVYALVVSAAAGECETYYWFALAGDATTNGVSLNEDGFFSGVTSGTNNGSATFVVDGNNLTTSKVTSNGAYSVTFTIPEGSTGDFYIYGAANGSSYPLKLIRTSDSEEHQVTNSSTVANYSVTDLGAGEWTLSCGTGKNWKYGAIAVKVCSTASCTDATPTAEATNTTVCAGSTLTLTASGYETSPTSIQWQKLNGSTWEDISGATSATYTVASAAASNAGSYRVIVTKGCARTSNTVTLSVPSAPVFGDVPSSVSVMQTQALSISTVEASDATGYKWYKSADATYDAGTDTEIGTTKNLVKAYDSEATGSPSYYVFCVASNSCGSTTSSAIAVNVTTYVEEDCATRNNEGDAEFGFDYGSAGQGQYTSVNCWTMNSNSKVLTYTAPTGKYFKTAKVTIASSSESKASYNWSTDGGSNYTAVSLTVSSTLTERTIDLSAYGNVDKFQIGRNFNSMGSSNGTLYVSKICFEYTEACTATTVTVSPTSKSHTIGNSWTAPTITLTAAAVAAGGTLTYSSSNEDIATVDDDGIVTFQDKAGTVTITASYAGDGTYCASEGSYTITVSCSDEAPNVVPASGTNMSGCNTSITLNAKMQNGTSDFVGGTYQWYLDGEAIDGATSASYTATRTGVYTVERTSAGGCTSPSSNSATITSETVEPEVVRLTPFQYYHVDSVYRASSIMRYRHLFSVKGSAAYGSTGRNFKMELSRNGATATDVTTQSSIVVTHSADNTVDTVLLDLNALNGKYSEGDELVLTCKAVDCSGNVSSTYKASITVHVINKTKPTLALICSGADKDGNGTRTTSKMTVGGDFLTGWNPADLCQQTGKTSWDKNTEWGLYTKLKDNYIVTPVNGYAEFNKLNYEPFDILFLTDYPKASKSDAAATILDDMAELCDYRPLFSFKTHMVQKQPSKWAAKGFTTTPEVPKQSRLRLNIVCYAHPMFASMKTTSGTIQEDASDHTQLVYTMLSGAGYESSKGMQGFHIGAAENFVTIGLVHYNATAADSVPSAGYVTWTPGSGDEMLVAAAERQANIEARMVLFSLNAGAHSKLTATGDTVVLKCLEYLLDDDPLHVADCSFTFDNGAGNSHDASWYNSNCRTCTGTKGDGKWSTAANWGPDYVLLPGSNTDVRIAASVNVDIDDAKAMSARIVDGGHISIPAGSALEVKSTIRRQDGTEISPTENEDIYIGSGATGNGTLIFNNNAGDTKARVDMYSTAQADVANMSAATSTWQYIGTPHTDVTNARSNYYGSWLYQYSGSGWDVIPNGGPLVPFRGYCITHPVSPNVYEMTGTLAATTTQDIVIPIGYTVIANSWVAPIDITTFTDDDMENISDKTIYFFNTGSDVEGTAGTGTEAGTYVAVPKNSASYVGTWQIPSMQGFYISTTSAGTLHLDYDRHVRPHSARDVVSNPMYAPRRAKAAEEEEPAVLKIFARGSRYQDKLVVLEREDFTRGYDSGWDGEAWGGGTLSPMVYVTGEGREDAVSAIPEFEGTVVAFKAGEDSEYRFEFIYSEDAEPLYLFDTENNTYTQIMTGNAYYFTTSDKAPHSRFILTRKAPQIATGTELTSDGEGANAKKLLIENKMYILLNGMLYDATGKVVK